MTDDLRALCSQAVTEALAAAVEEGRLEAGRMIGLFIELSERVKCDEPDDGPDDPRAEELREELDGYRPHCSNRVLNAGQIGTCLNRFAARVREQGRLAGLEEARTAQSAAREGWVEATALAAVDSDGTYTIAGMGGLRRDSYKVWVRDTIWDDAAQGAHEVKIGVLLPLPPEIPEVSGEVTDD